jgi:hypothetical protein
VIVGGVDHDRRRVHTLDVPMTSTLRPRVRHAKVLIVKQGRRIVPFEAQEWQDDVTKPIASAFGHFMLTKTLGMSTNRSG